MTKDITEIKSEIEITVTGAVKIEKEKADGIKENKNPNKQ